MKDFIVTFALIGISFAGMPIGVILSNKEIKGSCGGLGAVMGEDCDFCDSKEECPDLLQAKN